MKVLEKADLRTVVVAGATALLFGAAPAVAAVVNADTVDKKHAIGPAAAPAERAGKLVATNKAGFLPEDILKQAPDSDTLDGLDSADFVRSAGTTGSTAVNSEQLDGLDSTHFLREQQIARVKHATVPNTVELTANDTTVASTQVYAPRTGTVIVSVQSMLWSNHNANMVFVDVERDGTEVGNTYWNTDAAADGYDSSTHQWSWVLPVQPGTHTFDFDLFGSKASGSYLSAKENSITVTYIPN